jgi:hypothetical protein
MAGQQNVVWQSGRTNYQNVVLLRDTAYPNKPVSLFFTDDLGERAFIQNFSSEMMLLLYIEVRLSNSGRDFILV